ncbi:MAG: hypothetical protein WCT49_00015 [Candidatus Paceibacterota bacterium]|jgi:hypothetical protein|nr:hypothetical protein [Candidatus Paceibacterota bacterium]
MKKQYIIAVIAVLILAGVGWVLAHKTTPEEKISNLDRRNSTELLPKTEVATTTSNPIHFTPIIPQTIFSTDNWKIYQYENLGFTIKYPPQYSIRENSNISEPTWGSISFLSIYDPKDTSTYEFHVVPVHIALEKQSLIDGGKIYHTIDELILSGARRLDPKAEFVLVNGLKSIHTRFDNKDGKEGAEDAPIEEYIFIKNDILYYFFLNANNQYNDAIIQSVELR